MSADRRGKAQANGGAGPIAPGEHLRAELKRLRLDQVAVSKATGVSRQSINNIVNGRQAISRAMAGKLGRLTGRSSDYWLGESFSGPASGKAVPLQAAPLSLLVNHQIVQTVKDGVIGIEPFALKNLRAASINLTLDATVVLAGGERVKIGRDRNFILRPGHAVAATTVESIDLPGDYIGRVAAAAALCGHGILASCALHIEPGFKGPLHFCLFNAGVGPFRLRARDPVLGLEILRLGAVPDQSAA